MAAGPREGLRCSGHPMTDTNPKCQEAEQQTEPPATPATQGRLPAEAGAGKRAKRAKLSPIPGSAGREANPGLYLDHIPGAELSHTASL